MFSLNCCIVEHYNYCGLLGTEFAFEISLYFLYMKNFINYGFLLMKKYENVLFQKRRIHEKS